MFAPYQQLQQLADALRPALGLAGGGEVDAAMARLAEHRHRVAPLLHRAVVAGGSLAGDEAAGLLEESARANARRTLRQQGAAQRVSRLLDAEGVAHAFVKGFDLGPALYGSAALRQAKDVDLLVDPARLDTAIALLADAGFVGRGGSPLELEWAQKMLRFHWEVAVYDPQFGVQVEVHARLLADPPPGWDDTRFLHGSLDLSRPDYLLYLVIHGAGSRWHRLKWLADLAVIVQRTAPDVVSQTVALARRYDCLHTLSASLRACDVLWGEGLAAKWHAAVGPSADEALVAAHLAAFGKAIHSDESNPQRESLARRLEIVRAVPLFGTRRPSRMAELGKRVGFWYTHRF
ncbi:nucleotidyltransferase family protein [Aurantiacibacter luteus]|uniref:Nucleotidyltransferase family protein n=1 Tax=Aurantiacibacter luteus TaxID=1581420 RepID=A0A0G9N2E1_9SPHN|nr:nucleotidyltransferase family protein [Aurantiacibacter luteus]KLE35693.1 hypothetical protein AAW00_04665 [Aurantiacibacter luteus]